MNLFSRLGVKILSLLFILAVSSGQAAHYHSEVTMYPPWQGGKNLGELSINVTTKNEKAREHFLTGLKLVHTYEFAEATWSFREAQRLDPTFAMAYWGEIMASHMFVWYAKEPEQAQDAYKRMMNNIDYRNLTPKEQGLISAGRLLVQGNGMGRMPFEEGSLLQQFRDFLEVLHGQYPDDLEIKVLYGYAILGTRRGVLDLETNRKARKLFIQVLEKNPRHPGALHYLVHASENTVQAKWAKRAAETLGDVASASIHALHMPSHYYFARGDWEKVIDINQKAWEMSKVRMKDLGLTEDNLEYHGFGWIPYGLLQQGKYKEAFKALEELKQLYEKKPTLTRLKYYWFARAGFLIDCPINTEEFKEVRNYEIDNEKGYLDAKAANIFANLYSSWRTGDDGVVLELSGKYQALLEHDLTHLGPPSQDAVKIMGEQVKGLVALLKGDEKKAEEHLAKASRMEDGMVHEHGIPLAVKPANELYADFLLMQGREDEAVKYYRQTMKYQPKRLRTLEGLAAAGESEEDDI